MKTGNISKNRNVSETYCICFLGLEAILRRDGFKDAVLFKNHNPEILMNEYLFAAGVCFNLFSEYGVGKKLEPLIKELIKKKKIDPEENKDNIFFKEIVEIANEIVVLLRDIDIKKEKDWTYEYAIASLNKIDEISFERIERLIPLLSDIEEDIIEDGIIEGFCNCSFCFEFRKYNCPKDKHIDTVILEVLKNL